MMRTSVPMTPVYVRRAAARLSNDWSDDWSNDWSNDWSLMIEKTGPSNT